MFNLFWRMGLICIFPIVFMWSALLLPAIWMVQFGQKRSPFFKHFKGGMKRSFNVCFLDKF